MIALYKQYSDEEFTQIWNNSNSMTDFCKKLGYTTLSGDSIQKVRQRVDKLKLSDSHFEKKRPIKRNEENVFILNSTASQATLRRWYVKGKYTAYKCSICGQEPFWNGKELSLTLDHINGNNHDNRLENLRWICPNCDRQLDTFGSKNKSHLPTKKYYCIDCGKEISEKSKRCRSCNIKNHSKEKIESIIDRETLKNLIRINTFEEIARQYNYTSGNTVKNWCDYYNLPRLKKEINKISDEDWINI